MSLHEEEVLSYTSYGLHLLLFSSAPKATSRIEGLGFRVWGSYSRILIVLYRRESIPKCGFARWCPQTHPRLALLNLPNPENAFLSRSLSLFSSEKCLSRKPLQEAENPNLLEVLWNPTRVEETRDDIIGRIGSNPTLYKQIARRRMGTLERSCCILSRTRSLCVA